MDQDKEEELARLAWKRLGVEPTAEMIQEMIRGAKGKAFNQAFAAAARGTWLEKHIVRHMNKTWLHDEAENLVYAHQPDLDVWLCYSRDLFLAASVPQGMHAEALLWLEHPQRRKGAPPEDASVIDV